VIFAKAKRSATDDVKWNARHSVVKATMSALILELPRFSMITLRQISDEK
jgi:hypothetical protein